MWHRVSVGLLALLALASGCASERASTLAPLPFHVALLPVEVSAKSGAASGLRTELDPGDLTERIIDELEGRSFVRVSVLEAPGSAEPTAAEWAEAAKAAGADLVMQCEVSCEGQVEHYANDASWLNIAVYLFGGPLSYLINDRSYETGASLQASLFDVNRVADNHQHLDERHRVDVYNVREDVTTVDFIDRADGFSHYAMSIVIPVTFVARETEECAASVCREMSAALTRKLSASLADRRDIMADPSWTDFLIDPEMPFTVRRSGGALQVSGALLVRQRALDFITDFTVVTDQGEFLQELGEPVPETDSSFVTGEPVYRMAIEAEVPATGDWARIVVQEAGGAENRRSWTLAAVATP